MSKGARLGGQKVSMHQKKKKKSSESHIHVFLSQESLSFGSNSGFLELNQLGLLLVQICSPTQRYIRKVIQPQSESLRSHSTTGCILNLNFSAYHKNRTPPPHIIPFGETTTGNSAASIIADIASLARRHQQPRTGSLPGTPWLRGAVVMVAGQ